MNWVEQVVSEFGHRIGMPQLAMDERRAVRLAMGEEQSFGFFFVEDAPQPEVVVYRSMPVTYLGAAQFRKALQTANFRGPHPWPVQAASDQRELIIAMRIPERSFMVSSLEKALEDLGRLADQIALAG